MIIPCAAVIAAAIVLASIPGAAQSQTAGQDPGLRAAMGRFPPMILGPGVVAATADGRTARPCPAAGARVEQRGGPAVDYDGADPDEPSLCRMRFDGQPALAWFGIWRTSWPGAEQAGMAFGHLIHGRAGDMEGFVVRMSADHTFYDVLRNEGFETLSLLGATHDTVRLSHYREGVPPNHYRSVVTGWKDVDTGMIVFTTYQHISGVPETTTPLDPTRIDADH